MSTAYQIAQAQIGLNENEKRAALSDFLNNGGQNLDPATTAWCAAFVNATLAEAGQQGTGKLNARSYLDWGEAVDTPQQGDIAVFSRGDPNGWQGHVGFFDGYNDDGSIRVLGGNQGDAVNVSSYSADRLLGFRRGTLEGPAGQPTPQPGQPPVGQPPVNALAMAQQQPDPRQNALAMMPRYQVPTLDAGQFMQPTGQNALANWRQYGPA